MHILAELDDALRARDVALVIAHPFGRLGTELTSGSLEQRFAGRVFNSVDDAVTASQAGGSLRAGDDDPGR